MVVYSLLFVNIVLLVLGQTLWKIGLTGIEVKLSFINILKLIFNPYIFLGLVIYAVATIIWFYILSKAELSLVYPLQSLCYVLAAMIGLFFFKEHIPFTRWIGLMLIMVGTYFVSLK